MAMLLPLLESDRLKNGSVITPRQLLPSCPADAQNHKGPCLEEHQALTALGQPRPCFGSTKESLRNYMQRQLY